MSASHICFHRWRLLLVCLDTSLSQAICLPTLRITLHHCNACVSLSLSLCTFMCNIHRRKSAKKRTGICITSTNTVSGWEAGHPFVYLTFKQWDTSMLAAAHCLVHLATELLWKTIKLLNYNYLTFACEVRAAAHSIICFVLVRSANLELIMGTSNISSKIALSRFSKLSMT